MSRRILVGLVGTALAGFVLALTLLVAVFTRGGAPDAEAFAEAAASRAGNVQVAAFFTPDPPRQVGNTAWLRLTRGGEPVAEADVRVEAMMPEMGAMPEMRSRADVTRMAPGIWRARFDLEMGGGWTLQVKVDGKQADFGFTVGSRGLVGEDGSTAPAGPVTVVLAPVELPAPVLADLQQAMLVLDEVRARIAADTLSDVPQLSGELAGLLDRALPLAEAHRDDVGAWVELGRDAARSLGAERELERSRTRIAEVNRAMVALASGDPRLADGLHVFQCPMTPPGTFPKWIQVAGTMDNPYMGRAMPGCGVPTDWSSHGPAPGAADLEDAAVRIAPGRRQQFGIRTAAVRRQAVVREIRAPGLVAFDEGRQEDVSLTVGGWVRKLRVDTTGARVRRGQVLFEVYSPDLYAAQQEFLLAAARPEGDLLAAASRTKLSLLGLTEAQIAELKARGTPAQTVPIVSPADGYVVEKRIVEGGAFQPGELLFRVAPLHTVWVEADVYSDDLGFVAVGMPATVTLPNIPGARHQGTVHQLVPTVRAVQHTRTARIALANPDERLLPGMYADVRLEVELGERLLVPHTAVIYTGPRRLVFVDAGDGRLVPREVELGARLRDGWEIVRGLTDGEQIVVTGVFLVAAESRMRSATDLWEADDARR